MNIVGPIEVTRGCPFRCRFCATPFLTGGVVRHRSVEAVVRWLTLAVQKRGFRRTWFLSPNALCYGGTGCRPELERLEVLLREATAVENLDEVFFGTFPSEVRPEFVTEEALTMMRHYVANKSIQIGLQSGSDRVLKTVNRHHTVEQGLDAVRTALECGFVPHVDMIFGLPEESPEDLRKSIEACHLLTEMGALIHGHVFMPLPGSDLEAMHPGRLDPEVRRELGELARKKLMTGSWVYQETLGQSLTRKRT
jgi:B12-binding domain/radical SAM domain protein